MMENYAVGCFAHTLWALLSKPNTRILPVLNDTTLLNVHLAGYTLYLHKDGYLLAQRRDGRFLPVLLALARPGQECAVLMYTSAQDLYQALDHSWLAHALTTIDQQLEGTTFCAPNTHPKPGAWALWWAEGSWHTTDWTAMLDQAVRLVSAIAPADLAGARLHITLGSALLQPSGLLTAGKLRVEEGHDITAYLLKGLLKPLLTRTAFAKRLWVPIRQPSNDPNASFTHDIHHSQHTIPVLSGHERLALRARHQHDAWAKV